MKRIKLVVVIFVIPNLIFSSIFIQSCEENENITSVIDADRNVYQTVNIGNQVWMTENLKTTRFNDGTAIPYITDNVEWMNTTTWAYCWYEHDSVYKNPYGALYNWYAVKSNKLCPTGWHVPTEQDWETLEMNLRMSLEDTADNGGRGSMVGGKLKSVSDHWKSPNQGATNESGFTGLPGGSRAEAWGKFHGMGLKGHWWSSTDIPLRSGAESRSAEGRTLLWFSDEITRVFNGYPKAGGQSVRCLKD